MNRGAWGGVEGVGPKDDGTAWAKAQKWEPLWYLGEKFTIG